MREAVQLPVIDGSFRRGARREVMLASTAAKLLSKPTCVACYVWLQADDPHHTPRLEVAKTRARGWLSRMGKGVVHVTIHCDEEGDFGLTIGPVPTLPAPPSAHD